MRLIDADELVEHVEREKLDSRELIRDMIRRTPTVDADPVVRCKDCVWLAKYGPDENSPGRLFCSRWTRKDSEGNIAYFDTGLEWFCAGGEEDNG